MLLFLSTILVAMDSDIGMADAAQKQCLFILLPVEVRNRIAYYLDFWETDEAFVERIKTQKKVSDEHMKMVDIYVRQEFLISGSKVDPIATYSIDQSKILFLLQKKDAYVAMVSFLDIQTNTLVKNQFSDKEAFPPIKNLALSSNGTMLAQLVRYMTCGDKLIVETGTVRNRSSKKQEFGISEKIRRLWSSGQSSRDYKIGFNKQTTKVLAYSMGDNEHTLFPLVPEAVHEARSTLTFDDYFACRAICKPIASRFSWNE